MFNLLSLAIGAIAIIPLLLALIPFFGWMNWFLLPLPVIGLIIGTLSRGNAGRNLNLIVLIVAIVRLMMGHGFF